MLSPTQTFAMKRVRTLFDLGFEKKNASSKSTENIDEASNDEENQPEIEKSTTSETAAVCEDPEDLISESDSMSEDDDDEAPLTSKSEPSRKKKED